MTLINPDDLSVVICIKPKLDRTIMGVITYVKLEEGAKYVMPKSNALELQAQGFVKIIDL